MPALTDPTLLRLGTRGSFLARAQSGMIADELMRRYPRLHVELIVYKTTGDQITDRPLHDAGGKGLFTREIEQALLANEVDFAVHSFKDVPVTMPLVSQENLIIAAVPPREDPRDVLVSPSRRLSELPAGAKVGTGSLRRASQLLWARPDLLIQPVRGNIDTRLRKLREGQFDALILAAAGLKRAGLYHEDEMTPIEVDACVPAAGQGALAIQCRRHDARTQRLLTVLNDAKAAMCVEAERAIVMGLNGDCQSPIAAFAAVDGGMMTLYTAVGGHGGVPPVVHARTTGDLIDAQAVVERALTDLKKNGAVALLSPHRE